MAKDTTSI